MPNTFAYVALFSWPIVVILLFRSLDRPQALVWSILGGYLLLPESTTYDLPMLPPLSKETLPAAMAALCCLLMRPRGAGYRAVGGPRSDHATRSPSILIIACIVFVLIVPFGTVLTNMHPVVAGPTWIGALRIYDAFSMVMLAGLSILPFLLARRYLTRPEDTVAVLKIVVLATLAYSILILYEIRMSPQLNHDIYGFYSHSFGQQVRNGGFRAMVFIQHGLRVGILVAVGCIAAAGLWRVAKSAAPSSAIARNPGRWLGASAYLLVVLYLSKTLGAFMITFALLPVALFLPVRARMFTAAFIAGIVLVYPMLRGAGIIPVESISNFAAQINEDRALSLQFRLRNEDSLLERAAEKPLFGWGSWGRNRVYDPETGVDTSTTDGTWIGLIGTSGWIGYLAKFGLLTLPIVLIAIRRRSEFDPAVAGLSLALAANLLDLIPNSGLTPLTWIMAGSLAGRLERVPSQHSVFDSKRGAETAPPPVSRAPSYDRHDSPVFTRYENS